MTALLGYIRCNSTSRRISGEDLGFLLGGGGGGVSSGSKTQMQGSGGKVLIL